MCIGLGSLRVCSACELVPAGTAAKLCTRCTQQRPLGYFSAESDICSACQLQDKYAFRACSSCHKAFQISQLRENSEGRRMCHECAPEAWPYRCTACTKHKPASEFQHCRRELETAYHTRCKACETCIECKRSFTDHRSMAPDRRLCTTCAALANRKECTICNRTLDRKMFPDSQWNWASWTKESHNWFLRCKTCHKCTTCGVDKASKDFAQASAQCTQCSARKPCSVCGERLEQEKFGE